MNAGIRPKSWSIPPVNTVAYGGQIQVNTVPHGGQIQSTQCLTGVRYSQHSTSRGSDTVNTVPHGGQIQSTQYHTVVRYSQHSTTWWSDTVNTVPHGGQIQSTQYHTGVIYSQHSATRGSDPTFVWKKSQGLKPSADPSGSSPWALLSLHKHPRHHCCYHYQRRFQFRVP